MSDSDPNRLEFPSGHPDPAVVITLTPEDEHEAAVVTLLAAGFVKTESPNACESAPAEGG